MIDPIRQMFSKPNPNLTDEVHDFITKLAATKIWILAIGVRGTPSMAGIADRAAFIAANRKELSEIGKDDSVFPFNYKRDGVQILPFFTSEERARYFIANGGAGSQTHLFEPYRLRPGFVATPQNEKFELVLDPLSPEEHKLNRDERLLLRSLSKPVE